MPNVWNVTAANTGDVGSISFESFENLTGGTDTDEFLLADGVGVDGTIDGATIGRANTLNYSSYTTAVQVDLENGEATGTGGINNISSFIGGLLTNGLTAANSANEWNISAANEGTVGSIAFAGFQNLRGGTDSDNFVFADGVTIDGLIDGVVGTGSNSLDYSAYTTPVAVDLANNTATGTAGFSNIDSFVGSSGMDTIIGDNVENDWNITAVNGGDINGLLFSGFENLTGGTEGDRFQFEDGTGVTGSIDGVDGAGTDTLDYSACTTPITVNLANNTATGTAGVSNIDSFVGGSGVDTLVGDNVENDWNITALNGGNVNGLLFSGFENLTGGTDEDRFQFEDGLEVGGSIDGVDGAGTDTLDYSDYTTPVAVDLANNTATGTAGILNIDAIRGGVDEDTLVGPNSANQWDVSSPNAGTLNDVSFEGIENLRGGDDVDEFEIGASAEVDGEISGGDGDDDFRITVDVGSAQFTVNGGAHSVGDQLRVTGQSALPVDDGTSEISIGSSTISYAEIDSAPTLLCVACPPAAAAALNATVTDLLFQDELFQDEEVHVPMELESVIADLDWAPRLKPRDKQLRRRVPRAEKIDELFREDEELTSYYRIEDALPKAFRRPRRGRFGDGPKK